ncbi:hypothetical protein [Nocardia wallacei]|uniref:hypothetical protein n=1 Tax=Nocardia wallacei TaxID=480035 RepID=UPI002458E98C|nr:hypothetical protein [Nocardia wallacei]
MYNINLMRRVYEHITRHDFDQTHWTTCVAGWTVRLSGEWGLLSTSNPLTDGFQAVNFRTGTIEFTEVVAGRLLGMTDSEIAGIAGVTNAMAVDWLEDLIVAHDMRELDLIASGYDDTDYPIGEVRG